MIDSLKKLFGFESNQAEEPASEGPDRTWVATAVLLLEMAHADDGFHELESHLVDRILGGKFDLDTRALKDLRLYAEQRRQESLDLYQFAREINDHFSKKEKLEVMEHLWQIVFADGKIDPYEEALSRQLATLLKLSHKEMIDAKLHAREMSAGQDRGTGEKGAAG
ncbi:MAG: TerB family tellurite resistance protein [Geoalkalibacter sp.]|uniref:tellurite resistance TerB family protein n=1 Tax=Geoalkalibacter sp. TaxID=3041440 RepID=UPI003D0B459C